MDYSEWLELEFTRQFKKALKDKMKSMQEEWASGVFLYASADDTIQRNVWAIGYVECCSDAIDLLTEKEDEIQSERVQGSY